MAAQSRYEVEIVIEDGQAKARINGLTKGLEGLTTTVNLLRTAQEKNNTATVGTNKYYKEQIRLAEEVRDRTAKTSKEYLKLNKEIDALRLAQQELTNEVVKAQAPQEGTLAFYRKQISLLREEQAQLAKNNESWKDYESRINATKDKMEALTGATRMSAKPNQDLISSAGLAGATLTEFGRVISDANYGIRGIANNLSQLSFLFITLISKTNSAAAAFKLLWKQLMGPLGIILAFQTVISVLEGVSIAKEKSASGSGNLKKALDSETLALIELHKAAMAYEEGSTEREKALSNLAKANKELNNIYYSQALTRKEINDLMSTMIELKLADVKVSAAANALSDYAVKVDGEVIERQQRVAFATEEVAKKKAQLNEIDAQGNSASTIALNLRGEIRALDSSIAIQTKELNDINTVRNKLIGDYNAALENQRDLSAKAVANSPRTVAWYENQIAIIRNYQKNIATTSEQFQNAEKAVKLFQDQIDLLAGSAVNTSTLIRDLSDELAVINEDRFDAQRIQAQQDYRDTIERIEKEGLTRKEAEEARALAAKLRQEKINKINQEEKDFDLDLTEKAIKESQALEDKFEKDKQAASKAALDRIDKEALKATNAAKKTALETIKDKKALQAEFNRIDQENIKSQIDVINASIAAGFIGVEVGMEAIERLNSKLVSLGLSASDPAEKEKDPQKKLEKMLKQVQEAFNFVTDAAQASLDAELSIEESRTAMLNNSLRLRLRNEKLTAEQREAINNQIAKNEESLQQKRDKLAEKQFKLQKAISIGQALITTYEMASRAYNAVLAGPEKFLGISALALAKVAAGAATLFGLAQVRAISRQQFVPSAISTPSGGGEVSAPAVQAPDFNVVGQSNVSQLAAVVQGQLDRPVKTYVVASDVSTAQELERKKISTATI